MLQPWWKIAWLLPGKKAASFMRKRAESVCHMLGGDLTPGDEIQRRHSQVAGTVEEQFLLAGNSHSSTDNFPYFLSGMLVLILKYCKS